MILRPNLTARLLAGLVCLAWTAPAMAQSELAPWAKPFAGRWTLSGGSEGDPVCGVALGAAPAIGGAQIDLSATCRRNYPFEDVAGWRLDGRTIILIDALRKPIFRFKAFDDKTWSANLLGKGTVFLERGAPEKPASLRALFEEATFTLSGPNNLAPCGFSLTVRTPTSGDLVQAGRCASPWKDRGWTNWGVVANSLQLKSRRGVVLTLTRADEYTFTADSPSGPVFFGPGVIDGSEALEK